MKVLYHDNCFDGAASAAVFSRFYHERIRPEAEIFYEGLAHRPDSIFGDVEFNGDENAIVDFKYNSSDAITWWFDHHQSAFLSAEDEQHFHRDDSGRKFHDPGYKSCTKFIADIATEKFGFDQSNLSDLVIWADIIDGAQYKDAKTAVEMEAPAMKLTLVIEAGRDPVILHRIIQDLQYTSLADLVTKPYIAEQIDPLFKQHQDSIDIIRKVAKFERDVIFFDVSDYQIEGYNKFIPYYLFPTSLYSVSVSLSRFRSKISVGLNPWSPKQRRHNIATICERYGGGGHPVVGAISYRRDELEKARAVAAEIATELRET
jgi:hypothetical protein